MGWLSLSLLRLAPHPSLSSVLHLQGPLCRLSCRTLVIPSIPYISHFILASGWLGLIKDFIVPYY
jgi:hypothetical protein